jgi:hypothetical protein
LKIILGLIIESINSERPFKLSVYSYYIDQAEDSGKLLAAVMIWRKSGLRAAPPTRKPSMFSWEISSAAFLAPTDPPY